MRGMIFRHFIKLIYLILFSTKILSSEPVTCLATNQPVLFTEQTVLINRIKTKLSEKEYKRLISASSVKDFLETVSPEIKADVKCDIERCLEIDRILRTPVTSCTCPLPPIISPVLDFDTNDLDGNFDIDNLSLAYTHPHVAAGKPE